MTAEGDPDDDDGRAAVGRDGEQPSVPLEDRALSVDDVQAALQALGQPVATAEQLSRELDCSQAIASDALDELADVAALERRDVSHDPVIYYPRAVADLARTERVVPFPARREVVVDQPTQFTRARLSQFARLVETDTGRYLYEVRPEDVWAAPYESLERLLETVRAVLPERAPSLEGWIADQWARAGKFRLYTHEDDYVVLEAESESLMGNVARQKLDDGQLRAPISDSEAWVAEEAVAEVKRVLYEAGYPVQDDRALDSGDPVEFELDLELRDYQADWVERFLDAGSGVLVGPPGSGKTVAAMAIASEVGGETLLLVPSRELAAQWREELLANTTLEADQIGEYHGGEKEVRPVTIATYRSAGMDRHRQLFDQREWGLITFDECLSGDTVVETPDGRRTFEELDDVLELEEGWTRSVDFDVRTFEPGGGYEWTDVRGVYKTSKRVTRIETNTGQSIEATPNHTHLVFDPDTFEVREQEGVEEGDFLVRPCPNDRSAPADRPASTTEAELLGWFLGDGHCTEYDTVKFSFANRASRQVEILRMLADRLDLEYSVYGNERGDLTIRFPTLATALPWSLPVGAKAKSVSVPPECYCWGNDGIGAVLRGLFDAEGSVDKKGRIQLNTVSKALLSDVVRLLQKVGIASRQFRVERSDAAHNTIHRVSVPTSYNDVFRRRIGFNLSHKSERLRTGASAAMGVPVGSALASLKEAVGLTNDQLAKMADVSQTTIGGVIREEYRLGQANLPALGQGLEQFLREPPSDREERRTAFGVTYEQLADEMGCSLGTAHRQFERGSEAAAAALETIVSRRRERGFEYATRLEQLSDLSLHQVRNVVAIGTQTVYDLETESHTFLADGFLTHNCHHVPSPVFRRSADLQSRHRLGLTATPVREDENEADIYTLIGPPIGTDWDALFDAGYVAEPEVELRFLPWPDESADAAAEEAPEDEAAAASPADETAGTASQDAARDDVSSEDDSADEDDAVSVPTEPEEATSARDEYVASSGHQARQVAATNPRKVEEVRRLLAEHPREKALVFVDYLDQGEAIADAIDAPFLSGETRHAERERLLSQFRTGQLDRLVVSRVGDEGIDLPEAEVAVVASGLGGSRRQGAQRAGRTMRPAGKAQVYVLATHGTEEEEFARQRTRHLAGKGVRVREVHVEDRTPTRVAERSDGDDAAIDGLSRDPGEDGESDRDAT